MRAVVQRVKLAGVSIRGGRTETIGQGLVVLVGITQDDDEKKAEILAEKLVNLRIFSDNEDKLNLSVQDVQGEILIVSNFTLYGDCRRGRRPSYTAAAKPPFSRDLYAYFTELVRQKCSLPVKEGEFGADMEVSLCNDGPVTLILDTKELI